LACIYAFCNIKEVSTIIKSIKIFYMFLAEAEKEEDKDISSVGVLVVQNIS
jgi:hypothetical protein